MMTHPAETDLIKPRIVLLEMREYIWDMFLKVSREILIKD